MRDDFEDPVADGEPLVTVARFRSAAEAGYFADELEADESVRPILTAIDGFDGASGLWGAVYLLQVSADEARTASQRLRELLALTGDEGAAFSVEASAHQDGSPGSRWLPWALAFAAGSAVLFAVQKADRVAAPVRPIRMPNELLDRLAESSHPWVQALPEGGRRELRTTAEGDLILREDLDGDGRFDDSFRFDGRHDER